MEPGQKLGPFEILGPLGAGGMGEVFLAWDSRLERQVAIKISRQRFSERLSREARLACAVRHRSACQLLDIGEINGNLYLVMEYVEGETLAEQLRRGPLNGREAVQTMVELLSVLSAMHGRGLIHRDLKPSNIMMTSGGPRLIDFGLAANQFSVPLPEVPGSDATLTLQRDAPQTLLCGTPGYMAPEQVRGEAATPLSDLFAMGAILFEMITGRPAFRGASQAERLAAALHTSPPSVPSGSGELELDGVIRRALAKTPAARFASAAEFSEALRQAMAPAPTADGDARPTRIVVLPFRALREDLETGFLNQSLPEAITAELAAYSKLQVRSSLVGRRYAGEAPDLRAIAAEAAVDIAVTGTLLRVRDQIRVSTQLLQVPEGTVIATSSFQSGVDDLFDLQDQAVRRIVTGLGPLTPGTERQRDVARDERGYELYLRANLAAQDRHKLAEAQALYEDCLSCDSQYAPAWARLGRCRRVSAKYLGEPSADIEPARNALQRAVELNPDLDIAQSLYAQLETDLGQPVDAMRRLLRIGAKYPRSTEVYAGLTLACRFCGLLEHSVAAHRKARRLDPTAATSVTHTYFHQRAFLRSLETCADGIGYADLLALDGLGETAEAVCRAEEQLASGKLVPLGRALIASLAAVLQGECADVRAIAEDAIRQFWLGPEEKYYLARQVIRAGEIDWGMEMMGAAVRGGYFVADSMEHDPWLEAIRATNEFQGVLRFAREAREEARETFVSNGGSALISA